MLFALGAASSAIDLLSSLQQATSKPGTGFTGGSTTTTASSFDILSTNTTGPQPPALTADRGQYSALSPETLNALLAAQGQAGSQGASNTSASDSLKDLFSQLDANGDGQISKSEFENALGAGGTNIQQADDVFAKLDKSKDGSVDLSELSSALKSKGGGHHRHAGGAGGSSDQLLQSLDGASSTSTTNSDGSTTTSITYADGSKVTMTTRAASTSATGSASSSASSSYNFVEQLIRQEAQATSPGSAAHAVSVSA